MNSDNAVGTTFRLYLPVAAAGATEAEESLPHQPPVSAGPSISSILVVEDHPPLRELIATILSDAGYRVLAAASGAEAIRLAQGAEVDVVLTDLMMPGMSGLALIQQLRAQSPDLRVLFMSGHDPGI